MPYFCKVLAEVSQGAVGQNSGPQVSGPVVQSDTVGWVHAGLHVGLTQPETATTRWWWDENIVSASFKHTLSHCPLHCSHCLTSNVLYRGHTGRIKSSWCPWCKGFTSPTQVSYDEFPVNPHLKAPSTWSRKAAAATPWMLSLESGSSARYM